jgi:hypothetical protein
MSILWVHTGPSRHYLLVSVLSGPGFRQGLPENRVYFWLFSL